MFSFLLLGTILCQNILSSFFANFFCFGNYEIETLVANINISHVKTCGKFTALIFKMVRTDIDYVKLCDVENSGFKEFNIYAIIKNVVLKDSYDQKGWGKFSDCESNHFNILGFQHKMNTDSKLMMEHWMRTWM